jgi:hypothetical protein
MSFKRINSFGEIKLFKNDKFFKCKLQKRCMSKKDYLILSKQLIDAISAKKDADIKSNSEALEYMTRYYMNEHGTKTDTYKFLDRIWSNVKLIYNNIKYGKKFDYEKNLKIAKNVTESIEKYLRRSY